MTREVEQFLGASLTRQYKLYCAIVPHVQAIPEKKRVQGVIRCALRAWMECEDSVMIEDAQRTPKERTELKAEWQRIMATFEQRGIEEAFSTEDDVRARGMGIRL
jgi:hypothetical protein